MTLRTSDAPGLGLRRGHRPDIEGLRAVAVLLVVAFHAGFRGMSGGYVGVDVFFVLSGFLITGLLADELVQSRRISFSRFYGRRARRLLPMATVVLIATGVAFTIVLSPLDRSDLVRDIRASALYFANWHFAINSTDYMSAVDKSPVLHYWSLSVEEQFYLLWPVLLVLVTRSWRRGNSTRQPLRRMIVALAVVAAASLTLSILLTPDSAPYSYYGLHTRAWELAAGGLLALGSQWVDRLPVAVRGVAGWAGLAGIVASAFVITRATPFPGSVALLPVISTLFVVAAGGPRVVGGVTGLLSVRPLTYIGRISYAWYLWHWPCLILAGVLAGGAEAAGRNQAGAMIIPAHGWTALAAVSVSFVLSAASYRLYENPIRRSAWLAAAKHRSLALGATLTTATVAFVSLAIPLGSAARAGSVVAVTAPKPAAGGSDGSASTASDAPHRVKLTLSPKQARNDRPGSTPGCKSTQTTTRPSLACLFGDPDGTITVALIGDSHAHMWLPALDRIAKKRHWKLYMWEKPSCPMIRLTVRLPEFHDAYPSCAAYHENVLRLMRRIGGVDTVISLHFTGYPRHLGTADNEPLSYDEAIRAWGPAWADMEADLQAVAKRVVVVHDDPRSPVDVPACIAAHRADTTPCSFPRGPGLRDSNAVFGAERKASTPGTGFVNLNDLLCPGAVCPVIWYDGTIMYRDSHHLTATVVRELRPQLQARLVPLVEGHEH
jgi:peptidoglycan/LPS O-acetylase OafA/YrhL